VSDVPPSEGRPTAAPTPDEPSTQPAVTPEPDVPDETVGRVASTRVSASWTAVVAAAFVLILLVIFIGQNTQQSTVKFLWAHGRAPTSVVLLIAAVAGALVVIIVGTARILQLRRTAKHAAQKGP
jgi:uncharacterized integral membrane protein